MTVMALPITCASSVMGVGVTTAVVADDLPGPSAPWSSGGGGAAATPSEGGISRHTWGSRSVMLLLITSMITVLGVGRNQPVPLEVAVDEVEVSV